MKKAKETRKRQYGKWLAVIAAATIMVLCAGCEKKEQTSNNSNNEAAAQVAETPAAADDAVQPEPEVTEPEEPDAAEVEAEVVEEPEEADELTALYNDNKNQGAVRFTLALCEAGYDQICLVNGDRETTTYFSVKDGNSYTFPEEKENVILYIPYIPTEFTCDNQNIVLHYWKDEEYYKNAIQLYCVDFEGDDVPVNISVTFEDGSTQEITAYLTRHAE